MPPVFHSNFSIRKILANRVDTCIKRKLQEEKHTWPTSPNGIDAEPLQDENVMEKPLYTFSALIVMAIRSSSAQRLPLNGIQDWISINFPYYQRKKQGWQSQVRHTLSTNSCFIKVPRPLNDPGRGNYWIINPAVADMKINASTGRLQTDTYTHLPVQGYMYPMKHAIFHGVPVIHPQAPTAVFYPTPNRLGAAKQLIATQALQEQYTCLHFHEEQAQRLQGILTQMQHQQQLQPSYEQMYQEMLFHQQQMQNMIHYVNDMRHAT